MQKYTLSELDSGERVISERIPMATSVEDSESGDCTITKVPLPPVCLSAQAASSRPARLYGAPTMPATFLYPE